MHEHKQWKSSRGNDGGGFIWILGAIGALVFYIQQADSFREGLIGVFKSLVWPAILTFKVLEFLSR